MAPAAGVQIRHLRLTDLVYADDICLLAGSPQDLQACCLGRLLCHIPHGNQCGKDKSDGGVQISG